MEEKQNKEVEEDTNKTTIISDTVVVIEREFKCQASHRDQITGIQNLNE